MNTLILQGKSGRGRWLVAGLVIGLMASWMLFDGTPVRAQGQNQKNVQNANQKKPNKNNQQKPVALKPVAPPPPKSALLTTEDWQKAPLKALEPGEIDRLIAKELQQEKIEPAAITTDEQFIRRVTLDLTGQLPLPADVSEFAADTSSNKRAKLQKRPSERMNKSASMRIHGRIATMPTHRQTG